MSASTAIPSAGMGWLEAAFLGLLQGLTEFLPVSSSAHLRIFGPLLPSGGDPGAAFTAITQIGTEAAVLIYFRHDIARIASAWFRSLTGWLRPAASGGHGPLGAPAGGPPSRPGSPDAADARMGWLILVGTLPIAVLGLLFKDSIETSLRHLQLTAFMLIGFGLLLAWADRRGRREHTLEKLGWRDGLLFGCAQALALIPGVSRSGGTITAGLLMGYTREAAARYSFLLAIPAVLASGGYQLLRHGGDAAAVPPGPTLLATAVAFVTGYLVIIGFLRIVSTRGYMPFVIYRVLLGLVVLALLQTGHLQP